MRRRLAGGLLVAASPRSLPPRAENSVRFAAVADPAALHALCRASGALAAADPSWVCYRSNRPTAAVVAVAADRWCRRIAAVVAASGLSRTLVAGVRYACAVKRAWEPLVGERKDHVCTPQMYSPRREVSVSTWRVQDSETITAYVHSGKPQYHAPNGLEFPPFCTRQRI